MSGALGHLLHHLCDRVIGDTATNMETAESTQREDRERETQRVMNRLRREEAWHT